MAPRDVEVAVEVEAEKKGSGVCILDKLLSNVACPDSVVVITLLSGA